MLLALLWAPALHFSTWLRPIGFAITYQEHGTRSVALGALFAIGLIWGGNSAYAVRISADAPVATDLAVKLTSFGASTTTNYSSSSPSGYVLGVAFGWLGLAYESYSASYPDKSNNGTMPNTFPFAINYDVSMVDLILNPPIPGINLGIGYGQGTGKFIVSSNTLSSADLTQYLLTIGLPLGKIFDVHVGYRMFSGTHTIIAPNGPVDGKVDGTMTSIGLSAGW